MTFAPALTHMEQAAALGEVTKSEKLAWMRDQVRDGRYGQRGLDNLFKDFEGKSYIEPTIPGVTKNFNALNSLSPQQAKGAARTLLFATRVYQDPRFQLVAVDQPVNASYGRTDKDLVLRHRQTGQLSRIEVKDVKPASQRADLERIKGQIDKMAAEYKSTGELQAWANRQETIPAIKVYAIEKGIPVFETTKQSEFSKVLDDFDRRSIEQTRMNFASGGFSTGVGLMLLYSSTHELLELSQAETDDFAVRLKIGEQGAMLVAGGGLTASGLAQFGSQFASKGSVVAKLPLGGVTKWGGRLGFAGILTAEGFAIAEYKTGAINNRQFYTMQSSLGGGLAGGAGGTVIGFWIGGGVGCLFGPEAFPVGAGIGEFVGGVVGGFGGAELGNMAASGYYRNLAETQKQEVEASIYQHYGVSR